MNDPAVCRACRPSCCVMKDLSARHKQFPLAPPEVERLGETAQPVFPATVQVPNSPAFMDIMEYHLPSYVSRLPALFPSIKPNGETATHTVLNTTDTGLCVFLTPDGCSLPRQDRPYFCQLYPIWIRHDAFEFFWQDDGCQVVKMDNINHMLDATGLAVDSARLLYLRMIEDWGLL